MVMIEGVFGMVLARLMCSLSLSHWLPLVRRSALLGLCVLFSFLASIKSDSQILESEIINEGEERTDPVHCTQLINGSSE